jgi:hypothetical protein
LAESMLNCDSHAARECGMDWSDRPNSKLNICKNQGRG